jgi:membrane-bound ClpP family serine protease
MMRQQNASAPRSTHTAFADHHSRSEQAGRSWICHNINGAGEYSVRYGVIELQRNQDWSTIYKKRGEKIGEKEDHLDFGRQKESVDL